MNKLFACIFLCSFCLLTQARNRHDLHDKGEMDSLTIRQHDQAIGPQPYELPPEKTKEQLLEDQLEDQYLEKHKESSTVDQMLKDRELVLTLHPIGYSLLTEGQEVKVVSGKAEDSLIIAGLQKSIESYGQYGDQAMVANLNNRLGIYYAKNRAYDRAWSCFSYALAIEKELKDRENTTQLYCNLATIQKYREKPEEARSYYQLMYDAAREEKNIGKQAYALEQLAVLKAKAGRYTEAQVDLIKRVLPLYKKIRNISGKINAYNSLAYIYALEKKYTESRWFYLQAIKVGKTEGQGNAKDLSYSLYYLAGVKRTVKEYELAIDDYLAAAGHATASGDQFLMMRIYDELGDVYMETKHYNEASNSLKEYEEIKQMLFSKKENLTLNLSPTTD